MFRRLRTPRGSSWTQKPRTPVVPHRRRSSLQERQSPLSRSGPARPMAPSRSLPYRSCHRAWSAPGRSPAHTTKRAGGSPPRSRNLATFDAPRRNSTGSRRTHLGPFGPSGRDLWPEIERPARSTCTSLGGRESLVRHGRVIDMAPVGHRPGLRRRTRPLPRRSTGERLRGSRRRVAMGPGACAHTARRPPNTARRR